MAGDGASGSSVPTLPFGFVESSWFVVPGKMIR
jgi:hypothetical protein